MRLVATRSASSDPSALEEVLAQLDALAESPLATIPGTGLIVLDRELRIRAAAGPVWRTLGLDVDRATGHLLEEVARPGTYERLRPEYDAVLAGATREFALQLHDGRLHWHAAQPVGDATGRVHGILAITLDQSHGHHAQELYRVLAENATDVVTRHDAAGRYLYVSPSIHQVTGWLPDDLLGISAFELIQEDDAPRVREAMVRAATEGGLVTLDYRLRRADGTYLWAETSVRALPDVGGDGSAPQFQCSSRDVTQRRHAEEELERRLAQQSAVARLGEFALQRPDLDCLQEEAARLVAETLDVDLVYVLGHLGDTRMRVRAGVGWPDGFVGSEFEVRSYGGATPGSQYADAAVVIDDLPSDETLRATPLRANGVISSATVLIGERERPVGLLGAHTRRPRRFLPEDLDFLRTVAHVLAGALERVEIEERIRHDALHDALTGLPNRMLLLDRLEMALARAERDGTRVAVLFLDLDRLKVLNDSLGHHAGDELLRAVGPRLVPLLRPSDTLARFGGDEFAVVLQGVASERAALQVAERITGAFEEPFEVAGEPRFASASVGVVVTDPGVPSAAAELLSDADAAMYRAKELRRGGFELFDAGLRATITDRLRLEEDLRRALEDGRRLWVAYQPYWNLPERSLAGVEALVRWDHPVRGSIPPAEFIPVAEDSGLIVELGERVLREACRQVAQLRARFPVAADLRLTVNLSARQVASRTIVDTVAGVLEETGLPACELGLEITERLLLEESPATVATIAALQDLGVHLILDDFGTGYSSLRYLQRYPLNGLKIDRSFVDALGADGEGDGGIVEAIIGMARALGMRVVPEGVETEGQLRRLEALGCVFAQGFLLSRPLTPAALAAMLRAGGRPACA
jgi:diguanylate cyclase (GGDEF)-like protein/PAS domain S-box-containing protein